jgi:nitrite reductase/ring-hydroxylating ferredoxin subunit/uncharacterized membrane protein
MRSYASIKGHPVHPMLIVYPFAFLTGAFGFNVAAAASRRRDLAEVSQRLIPVGLVVGAAAAVPGLLDYVESVPPASSGKKRATQHALLNSAALGLFAASWLVGRTRRRAMIPLVMQGVASAAMSVAGYLGGTLVYRNQIAVDHRYANAGRWMEDTQTGANASALARSGEGLELNQMKLVRAGDARIVIGRTENGLAAFSDRCTHKGGPLSDGALICGTVQCPWHGSQFDVKTGRVTCGPAREDIPVYSIG